MSISNIHTLYAVDVHSDGDSQAVLGGISAANIRQETEIRGGVTDGSPYEKFQAIISEQPGGEWTTRAIASWLDTVGVGGKAITSSVNPGVNLYAQKVTDGGTRATGSNHLKYTIGKGLLIPRQLSVEHRGDASLTLAMMAVSDGTNAPVVVAGSAAVPSITAGAAEAFSIGPVSVGGVTISQITSVTIDFGINAETVGGDSEVWDTLSWIGTLVPEITIRTNDLTAIAAASIPLSGGKAATHANTSISLRGRKHASIFHADGDAEHITFTLDGLAYAEAPKEVGGATGMGEATIRLRGRYDGTNAPLTYASGQTL